MWWMALAGAIAGQASYLFGIKKEQDEINRQKKAAQSAYNYQKEYNDASFNLQRGEALDRLGTARSRLAEAFGADVEGFNLGVEGQALQTHAGRMSLEDSAGMALAAQGASGVRGSDSLQRQIDYQHTQFARQTDLQERGNSLGMRNIAGQYANQLDDIGREEDSWTYGGYRHEAKTLSDAYAKNMFGLQMAEYDHAYKEAGFDVLTFMTAGLGGASSGLGLGNSIEEYKKTWDKNKDKNKYPWESVGQ